MTKKGTYDHDKVLFLNFYDPNLLHYLTYEIIQAVIGNKCLVYTHDIQYTLVDCISVCVETESFMLLE